MTYKTENILQLALYIYLIDVIGNGVISAIAIISKWMN